MTGPAAAPELRDRGFERWIIDFAIRFIAMRADEVPRGIERALFRLGESVKADRVALTILDTGRSVVEFSEEWRRRQTAPSLARPVGSTLEEYPWLYEKILHKEPVVIARCSDLPREATAEREAITRYALGSVAIVPVVEVGDVMGILSVVGERDRHWTPEELAVMNLSADMFGRVIRHQREQSATAKRLEDLEAVAAEKESFTSHAAHDLNEPLRMIAGYCELVQSRYGLRLDEDGAELLAQAISGAKRMQELVRGLLDYSRIGTERPRPSHVDCQEMLALALEDLAALARERGARVTADPLPTVVANPVQLRQLFANLLTNAMKFVRQRPRVHVGVDDRPDEHVFFVRDNGIGIDAHNHTTIFAPFERLHSREEFQGSGLGLALCEKIVEAHGGRIWVDSRPNEGSTFYFTLPRCGGSGG